MANEKKATMRRKTVRKTTAPYARRVEDDAGDDGDKGKKNQGDSGETKADDGKPEGKADDPKADAKADAKADDAKPGPRADDAKAEPEADEPAPEPTRPTASKYAQLPPARVIVAGNPNDDAPPPGQAPPGDSRSYRRIVDGKEEFLLLYREHTFLISRRGPVGKLGTWSILEYPNQGAAAHAYAQECSTLRGEGFYDFYG